MKYLKILILLAAAGAIVYFASEKNKAPEERNQTQQPQQTFDVIVDTPQPNDLVQGPLTVQGRARGTWYFEANLPVVLKDQNGNILAEKGFQAQTDWMTTNYVDFNDTLTFSTPTTQYGTLIISKDNPSGDPNNDASFTVPVKFW